jgi:hypothetical protein
VTGELELSVVLPFAHLLDQFVLTYSNWESVSICPSESFEALSAGMQTAFWRLGGVPIEHRTDNLSAATHELRPRRLAKLEPQDQAWFQNRRNIPNRSTVSYFSIVRTLYG